MPRFAANLTMMYGEYTFLDRFAVATADGFTSVEYMFPYDFTATEIRRRLDDNGLTQALFNAPAGAWDKGDRGLAVLPGREEECRSAIIKALDYSSVIGNRLVHVMAGNVIAGVEYERQLAVFKSNLAFAADQAAGLGIDIVIEPINRRDMPSFFLNRQDTAQALCRELGRDNIKVLFDLYHCQITEGDLETRLRRDLPNIGHIQIAGVPDRHEPDNGEVNYPYLFKLIDQLGYQGWIGCEYRPTAGTSAGLQWFAPWRDAARAAV